MTAVHTQKRASEVTLRVPQSALHSAKLLVLQSVLPSATLLV